MPKFLVELEDGKKFQVEADQQPSPEEISQYLGGQNQPETPFLDISETASSLGRAVTSLPTTTMASLSQAWEGLENPWKRSEGYLSRRQEMQALQDELAASEAEAAASGDISTVSSAIREATPSLGFSGATLLPSLGAGAGTLALSKSPAAARGAAAATSALMAYRMAGAQFLDDAKERIDNFFQEKMGRPPDEREQEEAYQELLPLARKFGAAEAGPEALGNLALGGAGKYIRRALGGKGGIVDLASNALGKVTGTKAALAGAGALASEIGTEAVTGVEQDRIQKQFEEGIMRGESPESVALADRSLGDYASAIEEVAPATIATVGMMGAAGLGPKAISRGIQAIRSPQEQVEQIVEEPSMPDPAEVAKKIGKSSAEKLTAIGDEASAAAQAEFNAIAAETLGETPEQPVPTKQAAKKVEAEVTPSPAMEMPPPPQGVDMALAPLSPIINEAPLSEGAERNRAVIAENAPLTLSKVETINKTKADLDERAKALGYDNARQLNLALQTQSTLSDEQRQVLEGYSLLNQEIKALSWEDASELSDGDFSTWVKPRFPAENPKMEEELRDAADLHRALTKRGDTQKAEQIREKIKNAKRRQDWTTDSWNARFPDEPRTQEEVDAINAENASWNAQVDAILESFGEKLILDEPPSKPKRGKKIQPITDLAAQTAAKLRGEAPKTISAGVKAAIPQQPVETQEDANRQIPLEESVREEPQDRIESREAEGPSVGDQLLRPAEGEVQEEVVSTARDLSKPEQMTPEEVKAKVSSSAENIDSRWEKLKSTPAPDGWRLKDNPPMATETGDGRFYVLKQSGKYKAYDSKEDALESRTKGLERSFKERRMKAWADHNIAITKALQKNLPVSTAAVDAYKITLPSGYTRQGDLYVFQPQTTAAETQTPESVRVDSGAAGGVQSEPSGGSIPEVAKVSTETETTSSEKLDTVAQIDRLVQSGAKPEEMDKFVKSLSDDQFNELVASEAFDVEPNLAIKPKDTYDAKRIKRRKFVDAVNASTKDVRKTAQQVFQEEESAVKQQEKLDQATKSSLNSVVGPQKKDPVQGTVTKTDVETAREALTNSGEIPNAYLTNVYESREAFLADKANARLFPASYARLQTEKNIEGLYENGQTLIFAKQIQVSDLDRGLAKMLGITPEQAAARRVIAHENGHRAISLFTMAEKRELRGYLMRAYSEEQIAKLVERYTEYADWRTNPESRLEALEELLMRDFERMEKIPTGGVWDDIVQFLKRVWRRLTGQKGEPKLKELKDVVRLMRNALKRPAVPLGSYTLKDGGSVKLSIRAYHGTPHKVDKFSLSKIGTGEGAQAYGWGLYFAESPDVAQTYKKSVRSNPVPDGFYITVGGKPLSELLTGLVPAAKGKAVEFLKSGSVKTAVSLAEDFYAQAPKDSWAGDLLSRLKSFSGAVDTSAIPQGNLYTVELLPDADQFLDWDKPLSEQSEKVKDILPRIGILARGKAYGWKDNLPMGEAYRQIAGDFESDQKASEELAKAGIPGIRYLDGGSRGAGDGTRNYVIFDENLVRILEENGQSLTPPEGSDIRFSRPEFSSDTSAAFNAGSEAARSTLYSERDMDIREAIRRAYEAMPKTNSVAVPIGELFAKTEELIPGVTQDEFSNVLQDLFEDNGAVLQEGDVVEPLTEKDRRYLALAQDEESNRDELQRMVDEAARAAGFNVGPVYHGTTRKKVKYISPSKGIEIPGAAFLTDNEDMASEYTFPREYGEPVYYDENGDEIEPGMVVRAFIRLSNPLIYDMGGGVGDTIIMSRVVREAKNNGNDGVVFKNVLDGLSESDNQGTSYAVFESSQTKSADPVTRDDQGRIIPLSRRFDTGADIRGQINVTTPEGRRAGFVVVMPRPTKASRIPIEDAEQASKSFKADLIQAGKGRLDTEKYKGFPLKGTEPPEHPVKAYELYRDGAIKLIDDLLAKTNDIVAVADSLQDPEFQVALGLQVGPEVSSDMITIARQLIGVELQNRLRNMAKKERNPVRKRQIELAEKSASAYYSASTGAGQSLQNIQQIQDDPRYKSFFLFEQAGKKKAEAGKEKLDAITGGTEAITDIITGAEKKAVEETTQAEVEAQESAAEDDQDAIDLAAGEATLTEPEKSLYEEYKDILRRRGILDMLDKRDASAAKASISAEERNALTKLTKAERDEMRKRDDKRRMEILARLLGKESSTDTPSQKATRKKREKMVNTAKKRAESGNDIETPQEGESESSEEQVSKAERTAQAILKDLSERYSDPLIIKEKKPNVDAMRELYKERVKQGVGPNQMTEKSFVSKAVELGADEKTAGILWKAAELEIDAREAMRQDKILQRKAAVGARADAQAHRIIFAKERLKRQSGFAGIDTNPNKDTIIKAFRDQVKSPVSIEDFVARLKSLNVSETVAKRLFTAAEREKADLEAMEAFKALEGPDALKRMLREMNKARPADSVPLERAMPWRKILSSKPKDVAEYRQRILEAVSSIESFQNLTEEQKERLADLYAEAWEQRRQAIIDRMLRDEIKKARDRDQISDDVEKKLQQSRNKILEIINLGGFNNDDLIKILGERYGISTEFTEEQKARIQELSEQLQNEDLNPAKRNKLAMEFAVALAGATDVPVTEIIANWWTSSVLFGPQTIFSIGAAFQNGAYNILTIGTTRTLAKLGNLDVQGAIEESIAMLQGISRYIGAFKQAGRRAWQYLWSGDVDLLGAAANDILGDIKSFDDLQKFKRHKLIAENLAKDPRAMRRYVGIYLRFVNRLLTALDAFNVMVTKAGSTSIALRQSGMTTDAIIKAEKMMDLKPYREQVIRDYFDNKAPKTSREKGLVDSYAEAEMYRALDKMGAKMENADYSASESAFTMTPTGAGGFIFQKITGIDQAMRKSADEFLEKSKKEWLSDKEMLTFKNLALAYIRHFLAYQAANVAGYKFIRFASNKFNQGISYLPIIGLLRKYEESSDSIKGKEAFIDSIHRNQAVGYVLVFIGLQVVKALEDEPDDEKRDWFWNGGWGNLTPDQKKQLLAKGQKEYTFGFNYDGRQYAFNYQNWPMNQVLAAIGSMSDLIRFSPKEWNEKNALSKVSSGVVSGASAALDIPALSQLGELFGNRIASKDPTEQTIDRFSRIASGWAGGFVPRILKDLDFATQPELRKYQGLWEKTASHIPIYRRYVGDEYYDILGQPIKRNVIPGSREFMMGPTEPEYKILGALNSRNIWLTPANAEYRMVGKGRNRRRLTQEEADAYSLETGKGYRQMLLRYGQRALQMPTERARAFLQDKADEVRDRALKKVYRR